jgi:hypothetical protein
MRAGTSSLRGADRRREWARGRGVPHDVRASAAEMPARRGGRSTNLLISDGRPKRPCRSTTSCLRSRSCSSTCRRMSGVVVCAHGARGREHGTGANLLRGGERSCRRPDVELLVEGGGTCAFPGKRPRLILTLDRDASEQRMRTDIACGYPASGSHTREYLTAWCVCGGSDRSMPVEAGVSPARRAQPRLRGSRATLWPPGAGRARPASTSRCVAALPRTIIS